MLPVTLVFILSLAAKINADEHGVFFKIEENSFLYNQNSIWNGKAGLLTVLFTNVYEARRL